MKAGVLILTMCVVVWPAQAKYSGGSGTADNPYQIATAADLIALGETPEDYDKHFLLTADIDLDPKLPGRKVFDGGVIAPDANDSEYWFQGTPFTGVFDARGHAISHLTIMGGSYLGLFGCVGSGAIVSHLGAEEVAISGTGHYVGALVGENAGCLARCYSTGTVNGTGWDIGGLMGGNGGNVICCYSHSTVHGQGNIGGLVGINREIIADSYSTGGVSGNEGVGGLVGLNWGGIATSYSTGTVTGDRAVGGLVGTNGDNIASSFWDVETSGQSTSAGGTGLTTAEMQDINTYLSASWDAVGEMLNGTCDYWQLLPGDYPRLRYHAGDNPVMPEGLGTAQEPYLIRDARDLGTVWFKPMAHYRLEASLDLSGITWPMAVVPWFGGTLDGNGYAISYLTIVGQSSTGLFGQLGPKAEVRDLGLTYVNITSSVEHSDCVGSLSGSNSGAVSGCYSTGVVEGDNCVGGLVGSNTGHVICCNSAVAVNGDQFLGGLAGANHGAVIQCYSAGSVSNTGKYGYTGGLVGSNTGSVTQCYSMGAVTGDRGIGGLVGNNGGLISACYSVGGVTAAAGGGLVGSGEDPTIYSFWDIETSGQTTSAGGTGKTTTQMQRAATFLEAGWDFTDETDNGREDIWQISEGHDYPRLAHRLSAFFPGPEDGAIDVIHSVILNWRPGGSNLHHDIYVGEDGEAVANATPKSPGIYRGRQPPETTGYDPGPLQYGTTYYWRIDEVNEADPSSSWHGHVWQFTTVDFLVLGIVDDFESYTDDEGSRIYETWIDGWTNGSGSIVGCLSMWCPEIWHGGQQSMPFGYDNVAPPYYSEAYRTLDVPQDWTTDEIDTLTLYIYVDGRWIYSDRDRLYVALKDRHGRTARVVHSDPDSVMMKKWIKSTIPLSEFAGVDRGAITRMYIGVGDRENPQPGGAGSIYIDDIRLTKRTP